MYHNVTFTGRVAEILHNGEVLIEARKVYTPRDGSAVREEKAYIYLRQDGKSELEIDHLVHVEGYLIPGFDGTPLIDGDNPKYIVGAADKAVTILGPYIPDVKDSDFFKVEVIGRCGRDANERKTTTGKTVVDIGVAADLNLGVGGKKTIWFKVTDWPRGDNPSPLVSFKKGEKILVRGFMDYDPKTGLPRSYTKDGVTKANFDVSWPFVRHLSWNNGDNGDEHVDTPPPPDEDIPF